MASPAWVAALVAADTTLSHMVAILLSFVVLCFVLCAWKKKAEHDNEVRYDSMSKNNTL